MRFAHSDFSQYQLFLLYEINAISFYNKGLIFTPEVFTLCKRVLGPRESGVVNLKNLRPKERRLIYWRCRGSC